MNRLFITTLVMSSLVVTGLPAVAFAQATCAPFEMVALGGRIVATHDQGEEGLSLGDLRVGERQIGDAVGNPIGEVRWTISPLDPDHSGVPTHNQIRMYFLLNDGTILTEGVYRPQQRMGDADTVTAPPMELVVLGGTGAYRNARGVVEFLPTDRAPPHRGRYKADISCI